MSCVDMISFTMTPMFFMLLNTSLMQKYQYYTGM